VIPPIPGPQSYLILFLFPVLVFVLFRRMELRPALVWSITLGYLLLPAAWVVHLDLPALPTIDKELLPALSAAAMAYLVLRQRQNAGRFMRSTPLKPMDWVLPGILPRSTIGLSLLGLMFFGMALTVLTNRDPLFFGDTMLPGQGVYGIFSGFMSLGVMLLPMFLGRKFLADNDGHKLLLTVLCVSAAVYTVPALYEVRMSPQLNIMLYGFFQHDFAQHMRAGGFRPLVFLDHGLLLGIYFASALVAMAVLARLNKGITRAVFIIGIPYLLGVLFLSKTIGAAAITMLLLPVALFLPVRLQMLAAAVIAGITISYPLLRGTHLIPTDEVVSLAASFSPERAGSLQVRIDNEELLLERASERPLFGWSGWGRWRLYDETGRDITISDGLWIITIAQWGWVGYIAKFGMLCLPLILFTIRQKRYDIGLATAGMCLVIAANLIDQLPNASVTPLTWLAAGALLGRMEIQRASFAADVKAEGGPVHGKTRPQAARTSAPALASGAPPGPLPERVATQGRYSRFAHHNRRQS
jgi:hypothetical protein